MQADLVLLLLTSFECQPSQAPFCLQVHTLGNVAAVVIQTLWGEHYSLAPFCLIVLNILLWGTVFSCCTFFCQCCVAVVQIFCLVLTIQTQREMMAWDLSAETLQRSRASTKPKLPLRATINTHPDHALSPTPSLSRGVSVFSSIYQLSLKISY